MRSIISLLRSMTLHIVHGLAWLGHEQHAGGSPLPARLPIPSGPGEMLTAFGGVAVLAAWKGGIQIYYTLSQQKTIEGLSL